MEFDGITRVYDNGPDGIVELYPGDREITSELEGKYTLDNADFNCRFKPSLIEDVKDAYFFCYTPDRKIAHIINTNGKKNQEQALAETLEAKVGQIGLTIITY